MTKRFRFTVRVTDQALDALGATGTGEEGLRDAVIPRLREIGVDVEEVEGLDLWPLATGGPISPERLLIVGEAGPEEVQRHGPAGV